MLTENYLNPLSSWFIPTALQFLFESKKVDTIKSILKKKSQATRQTHMNVAITDSSLLLYQTEDGQTRIEVRLQDETVWLNQAQLCELFDKDKRTISEHIQNIFKEKELIEESVVRKFRTTASDGKNYQVTYYNLDVIISVGYRVSSHRGTQFRIWATQRLKEYLIKGFTLDDDMYHLNVIQIQSEVPSMRAEGRAAGNKKVLPA